MRQEENRPQLGICDVLSAPHERTDDCTNWKPEGVASPVVETTRSKFFIDTEFIESGPNRPIELLSIGIVAEDGRTFYAVDEGAVLANVNAWVQENVLPHLGGPRLPRDEIRLAIKQFIGDCKPEFWGYYADYDWVVFCQIFGAMIDLPKGWPMYCRDIKQLCDSLGNPKLPKQSSLEHNALNDARWNKIAYEFLAAQTSPAPPQNWIDEAAKEIAGGWVQTYAPEQFNTETRSIQQIIAAHCLRTAQTSPAPEKDRSKG